jgi:aspartate racemase
MKSDMYNGPVGRSLGLIGGLGVGATVHYYQELVKAHAGRGCVPHLLMVHADVDRVLRYAAARDAAGMAEYLAELIERLHAGGAEVVAISSVTPHLCAAELAALSPLPLVNMIEAVLRMIHARGLKRIALFGTRFTIETSMFGQLSGVDIVMPKTDEIDAIHEIYLQIVKTGNGNDEQYQKLRRIAQTLCERDQVDAIVLGGTELSLVFNEANTDFPHIDAARVHIDAIMQELFAGATESRDD